LVSEIALECLEVAGNDVGAISELLLHPLIIVLEPSALRADDQRRASRRTIQLRDEAE